MNSVMRWWSDRRAANASVREHRRLIREGGFTSNKVGTSEPRGRPKLPRAEVQSQLSELSGSEIRLPDRAVAMSGPETCPACGAPDPIWGCDRRIVLRQPEIHPKVWDPAAWMADSFVCRTCSAGWVEPDEPEPITWVRPYWCIPGKP